MRIFSVKFFVNAFAILLFAGLAYYFRNDVSRLFAIISRKSQPCQKPITYSIVNVDPRFGLTKTQILDDVARAEAIWEAAAGKQLFEYSPTGDLKINFIYDYRQETTDALKKIGVVIHDDRSTYDALKAKESALVASYNEEKSRIDKLIASYNADKISYEKDVAYWNGRGGAPKPEYDILENKRIGLNSQISAINQDTVSLNDLSSSINSANIYLNKLISTLNLQITKYNTVGSSTGDQFKEGLYTSDASGETIDIYQFNDSDQLVRLLAHELGHALGLDHLNNPKAIMYYLNEGENEDFTVDDLAALKTLCGIAK